MAGRATSPNSRRARPTAEDGDQRLPREMIAEDLNDDEVFFLDEDDFHTVFQDDYYARLNVDHNASQEEIRNSYRRLSRLLHPDKHTEPWKKSLAENAFNSINAAYEVLRDPYRKSLYDACGASGTVSDLWQVVPVDPANRKTLDELKEEREKRKEKESTNPHNEMSMGLDVTDLFERRNRDTKDYGIQNYIPHVEITTLSTVQSIEAPWPQVDRFQLFSNVNYERGTGGGMFGVEMNKTLSETVTGDFKVMTGPSRGLVAHLKLNKRLDAGKYISLSAFSAFSRFGMMPLMEIAYGSNLGKLGNGRVIVRGTTRVVNVVTRIDKDFKDSRFSVTSEMSPDDVVLGITYSRKLPLAHEPKLSIGLKTGFRGVTLEYGVSRRVSKYNQLAASMALALPGGVTLRITFQRSNQAFSFPILLSHDILPAPVFYGTVTPLLLYACVKSIYFIPQWKAYVTERLRSKRNSYRSGLEEKRKEYENFLKLMIDKYEDLINSEGLSNGLVIDRAVYGRFDDFQPTMDTIDVHVQLQCLVRNHQLDLPALSKTDLPGFYDPCISERKRLQIHYIFGGKHHLVQVMDDEALHLPSPEHLVVG
ncbi:dnaJ homolog subfamily C member 11-like [Paramacrobiotus metropolitanus]|uniref:dnaJ homolog subfamily C member 11-like n=1 Tax=Paramacrobiotus metropolitanus TaxID=2943436 RepID=UPI00244593E5|nr:dnaJ homolog subfamily C member 11-like [Paramacrobiotus metropolitanus]